MAVALTCSLRRHLKVNLQCTRSYLTASLAVQFFNEALMLDHHDPVALRQMAEIRTIQGHTDTAEQYLAHLEQDVVRRSASIRSYPPGVHLPHLPSWASCPCPGMKSFASIRR